MPTPASPNSGSTPQGPQPHGETKLSAPRSETRLATSLPGYLATSQSGAMFGLDARIALAIFSILSIVAGAAIVINLDDTAAKALAGELADTSKAVEALHQDLKTDVFQALQNPSDRNAFKALFDNSDITEDGALRSRWSGPYIRFTSTLHPKYGEMLMQKRKADHTAQCDDDDVCYLWLVYGEVKPAIIYALNDEIDGKEESKKNITGRVQWTIDRERTGALYYRAARALSSATGAE